MVWDANFLRNFWKNQIGGLADLTLEKSKKNGGIYNLNSLISSRFLRILASQSRFQSLYDELFNIDKFLE